jgi:diaminopimelate epimerase
MIRMRILFSKYHGAGNDFILIKDIDGNFPTKNHKVIRELCDRRFGIGADGLMLLRSSEKKDFTMLYFNSNGHEGTMCGNGGRCLIAFAKDCGYINKDRDIIFDAIDGEHEGLIIRPGLISLKMGDVNTINKMDGGFGLNTGSVHHVEYVDKLVDMDVCRAGRALREHKMYKPDGCNVNYIEEDDDGSLSIRTYERGVENETLACGTGSVAAAIVHHSTGHIKDKYVIRARGGELAVRFQYDGKKYHNIWLEGPVAFVFEGVWKK